jgi:serine phosphatase RsbU (regulator of sigma subunit)
MQLAAGDSVLFASDGMHELPNRYDQDFSRERLAEIWGECYNKPADESLGFLFEEAGAFSEDGSEQRDDITALVLGITAQLRPRASGARKWRQTAPDLYSPHLRLRKIC